MGKKKFAAAFIAVILCFSLSGCSFFDFFGAESLLRPPKLTGENSALQTAFESEVGKNVILFSPVAGDYRSSYIFFDYNGDDIDEAVVFYAKNENKNVVHMHIMAVDDGAWYSVSDNVGSGTDVYKVDFFDLDNNDNKEIAVTWVQEDSKRDKTMSLYKIDGLTKGDSGNINSIATIQLSDYVCLDIDNDSVNELLYFYFDTSGEKVQASAKLLELDTAEMTLSPVSEIKLDSGITSFQQLTYDNREGQYRVYMDCVLLDTNYCTEVLAFDAEKSALIRPSINGNSIPALTIRKKPLFCTDFNNDSYIDIPSMLSIDEENILNGSDQQKNDIMLVEWMMYSDNLLNSTGKYFINRADGYSVALDDFYNDTYIVYDFSTGMAAFKLKKTDSTEDVLFTISGKNRQKNPNDKTAGNNNEENNNKENNKYLITVTAIGQSMNFTQDYIKKLIFEY